MNTHPAQATNPPSGIEMPTRGPLDAPSKLHSQATSTSELSAEHAVPATAKWSYVTRNVRVTDAIQVEPLLGRHPEAGDLILAEVVRLAQHTKLQLNNGRRSQLFPGDLLVVAFGHRYAPDQYEAQVPADLGACHLVASGGIAAKAISRNTKLKWPTQIQPVGYLVDRHQSVLNLRHYKSVSPSQMVEKPVICVAGTSMNAGKTTAVAALVKGLTRAGKRVAAVKVTGTGAGNDMWAYEDAGALTTLDFTDAGHASTFRLPPAEIETCFYELVSHASSQPHIDVVVVEIADGLLHHETMALLASDMCRRTCKALLFAAGEAMGALAGVQLLQAINIPVLGISGVLSTSKLAREEASKATGLPVFSKAQLEAAEICSIFV